MELNDLLLIFGTWLMADGVVSIRDYYKKKGETWVGTHSIRLIRMVMGIAIIVIGTKLG